MKWLRNLLSPFPWDEMKIKSRIRALRFRVATAEDFPFCDELHRLNESFGVPHSHRRAYAEALRRRDFLALIVEEGRHPVATCGIQLSDGIATFCYGLVHPSQHRKGIGTTMVIGRIALLPVRASDHMLAISALDGSVEFYRQFGFRVVRRYMHADGFNLSLAVLNAIHSKIVEDCRGMILGVGGTLPEVVIPAAKQPNKAPEPTA